MSGMLFEITAITGRRFRIMATSPHLAMREAVERMSQFEAEWGVMSLKRIEEYA